MQSISSFTRLKSHPWVAGSAATLASFTTLSAIGCYRNRVVGIQAFFFPPDQPANIALSVIMGALVGALLSDRFKPYRKYLWWLFLTVLALAGLEANPPWSYATWFLLSAVAVFKLLKDRAAARDAEKPTTFGSAEWADLKHIQQRKLTGTDGFMLGNFVARDGKSYPIHYTGPRHLLTVAPTRGGKGVSAIIPNLLTYTGSVLVIDPKGENARTTARQRKALGQAVHVIDPWGITGMEVARFNPLDWLEADDPDIDENAFMLADAMIVRSGDGKSNFWDDESAALLWGLILYVALNANAEADRSLAAVRDLITLPEEQFDVVLKAMYRHPNHVVSSTGGRTISKDPELKSNVVTSLQSHTHFLDSPRIRESLRGSDFRFEDLKAEKVSVFLVLPADRLGTFGRWLRLLIQQAITVNARNIEIKPEKPILFLLDEMAALGRLTKVEEAYGLMAGFGMQLWGIVQDLGQLDRIYDKGWETFIGNSGVLQYFGSRDLKTAEYFSKLCGMSTIIKTSLSRSIARAFGSSSGPGGGSTNSSTTHTEGTNTDHAQRALVFPDELMVMRRNQSLVLIENNNPIDAQKITWYQDERLALLGDSIHDR